MHTTVSSALALRPMCADDLPRVLAIEQQVYGFPWTRGNFADSLAAGYRAELLVDAAAAPIGYSIAMPGVDEMHLLNLTVAPAWQRQGHALRLLDALRVSSKRLPAAVLWLEVRAGNVRARGIYRRYGFVEVGCRPRYYPAAHGAREDAIQMRLDLAPPEAAS
jgi:ribosomal-protein-alanine N-acetyltransferase